MSAEAFPPIPLRIRYERDASVGQALLADLDRTFDSAESKFEKFSAEANRLIDVALGKGRNSAGALDLDVPGLQAAAKAQEARAIAAREVAKATALARQEEQDYSIAARQAVAATEALAREEEQAAAAARSHATAAEQVQERLNRQASATQDVVIASGRGANGLDNLSKASGRTRIAILQSGQQLQDLGVQLYSGQRATVAFAQQLPQLAYALTYLEGSTNRTADKVGKFATFLSSPAGFLVIGAASVAIGALVQKLIDLSEGSDKSTTSVAALTEKLRAQTTEAKNSRAANQLFSRSLEGVEQAAIDAEKALAELEGRQTTQEQKTVRSIQTALNNAKAIRAETQAMLEASIASNEQYRGSLASTDPRFASQFKISQDRLDALRETLKKSQQDAKQLEKDMIAATSFKSVADASRSPEKIINDKFDAAIERARRAAVASGKVDAALRQEVKSINAAREAELKRLRDTSSTSTNRQFGREVNSAEARSIAEAAGFRVTSADRTRAEQQYLYDTRRTAQNPVALPGTSAHEKGNALDIAFGAGVTPASIKKAFADEGVKLTKLLKESGHYHIEFSTSGADKAARDAEKLAKQAQALEEFGQRAADKIAGINARFDEQPRLVDAANAATRQLDDTIRDLQDRKPPGFEQLIADAEKAKTTIQDALVRPFRELAQDSARTVEINRLIVGGREKEAAVLQEIWRIEQQLVPLNEQQKEAVTATVTQRERELDVLDRLQQKQGAYLDATRGVRSELENLFSGQPANFGQVFKRLAAQTTVENLFGDAFRKVDREVKSKFDIGTEALKKQTDAMRGSFGEVETAAKHLAGVMNSIGPSGLTGANDNPAPFDLLSQVDPQRQAAADNNEILVVGQKPTKPDLSSSAFGLTPGSYGALVFDNVAQPILRGLPPAIAQKLGPIFGGAIGGYFTGGVAGGFFGTLKGIDGLGSKVDQIAGRPNSLGKAVDGATTGTVISGIGNSLGLKLSTTGAQIGGAIGSFIQIPGGDIIGSIAGGLLGNLFGKRPRGAAEVSNSSVYAHTNDAALTSATNDFGGSIQQSIKQIADALGVSVGNYSIGLGRYKEYFQVSSKAGDPRLGNSYFHQKSPYSLYDGTDPQAAAAAAIAEAIAQGAIKGLSATAERILKNTPNIDQAVQNILDFQSVFTKLKAIKDPVGAALDDLDKQFSHLRDIFQSAGATTEEYAKLEELYGIERKQAIEQALQQSIGSIKSLLDNLTIGDSGLSLRDRQANAQSKYDALATRVKAGDTTAYSDYATAAQDLLDIERQLYGSTKQYFDTFNEVKNISQGVVDQQQALIDQASNSNSGLDMHVVKDAVDGQTNILGGKLDGLSNLLGAVNDNLITLARQSGGGGGGSQASLYQLRTSLA